MKFFYADFIYHDFPQIYDFIILYMKDLLHGFQPLFSSDFSVLKDILNDLLRTYASN